MERGESHTSTAKADARLDSTSISAPSFDVGTLEHTSRDTHYHHTAQVHFVDDDDNSSAGGQNTSLRSSNTEHHPLERRASFTAIDPFKPSVTQSARELDFTDEVIVDPEGGNGAVAVASAFALLSAFLLDTAPRQVYLHFLLRLPYLYYSRVTHIFFEAELSFKEIRRMALEMRTQGNDPIYGLQHDHATASVLFLNLKATWEDFIDSLVKEWKILNIVSVLLLSAILTILQIPRAADNTVVRYSALGSSVCALMSLLYGCMYIIRFGSMRKVHKAVAWAREAQRTKTHILWNVWILLAVPAVWLSWSIILYITCIMGLVWRTQPNLADATLQPPSESLAPRVAISCILAIGFFYFCMILITFHRYGSAMDQKWREQVEEWSAGHSQRSGPSRPASQQSSSDESTNMDVTNQNSLKTEKQVNSEEPQLPMGEDILNSSTNDVTSLGNSGEEPMTNLSGQDDVMNSHA